MERWEINGDILEFDEETHTYWVNGEEKKSVTQVLKMKFAHKYDGVDEATLKKAAEKGSWVHETIEVYEKYGIASNEVQEFRDYMFLKKFFKFEVRENEIPIILKYKDLTVCGRIDLVLQEDQVYGPTTGLGDIKCTSAFDKEYLACQLNLYRLGYQQSYGEEIKFLRGLHLKNGKRKYADIPINEKAAIELLEQYIGAEGNE